MFALADFYALDGPDGPVLIAAGQAYPRSHWVVVAHPDCFEVEQAKKTKL